MYIQPNSNIYLLQDVGLDNTYAQTHYFNNVADQHKYFASRIKHQLTNYSYTSTVKNKIRIGLNAESCYNCTYLMFQNSSFGTKWFYAFITDVDYISNNCTEITYELDYLQSYLTEYNVGSCFVERQHSATDTLNDNYVSENIDIGEYVGNESETIYSNSMNIIVAVADADRKGDIIDNVYTGCQLIAFTTTDTGIANLNNFLQQFITKPEALVALYMCPDCACKADDSGLFVTSLVGVARKEFVSGISQTGSLDGYKPKNKKLYTYPFNYYRVTNGNGGELNLRYELKDKNRTSLMVSYSATCTQPVQLGVRPINYKNNSADRTEVLVTSNYPVCAWSNNTYQNWVGTQAIPNLLSNTVKAVGGMISGNIASTVSGVSNILMNQYNASIKADTIQGSQTSGGVNLSKTYGFIIGTRMSVTGQQAKIIDDYFTRYGYAIKRIVKPDITSRKAFNYIKTIDCCVKGNIPSSVASKISAIYNNGITFWHNHNEIGNYDVDNTL